VAGREARWADVPHLILNLPPMSQSGRDATPIFRLFKPNPTLRTYTARPETVDLQAKNPATGPLADASLKLDFSSVDRADPSALSAILWASLRPGVPMAVPVRSAASGLGMTNED
jgi:hypothetical protein